MTDFDGIPLGPCWLTTTYDLIKQIDSNRQVFTQIW